MPLSMLDGLAIRTAQQADLLGVARIASEREGESIQKWLAAFQRIHLQSPVEHSLLLVAVLQDHVIGFGRTQYFVPPGNCPGNTSPEGWYLMGLIVAPKYRRLGVGLALTRARLKWIAERSTMAYYFVNELNLASIDLHRAAGFVERTRDFRFPGVQFCGGRGILFECNFCEKAMA